MLMVCYVYITVLSRIPIADLSEQLKWHQRQIQEGTCRWYSVYFFVITVNCNNIGMYVHTYVRCHTHTQAHAHSHADTHTHTCARTHMDTYTHIIITHIDFTCSSCKSNFVKKPSEFLAATYIATYLHGIMNCF